MKNYKSLGITVLILVIILIIGGNFISFNNKEVDLRTQFEQKMDERPAFYDKMKKIFSQKAQIAVKNDTSFRQNVNTIMTARSTNNKALMNWIQESNPNANYAEVSALYKDLSRAIESERIGFFEEEKMIQSIVKEHKKLLRSFPGNILAFILGKRELIYKPITSDQTDEVMRTGKDNDTKVF